jgi:hypothetical protein
LNDLNWPVRIRTDQDHFPSTFVLSEQRWRQSAFAAIANAAASKLQSYGAPDFFGSLAPVDRASAASGLSA